MRTTRTTLGACAAVAWLLATLTQPVTAKLVDVTLPELVAKSDLIMVALERPTIEFGDEVETFRATFKRMQIYKGPQDVTTLTVCQSGLSSEDPDAVLVKNGYWYFLVRGTGDCYRVAWGFLAILRADNGDVESPHLSGQPPRQLKTVFEQKVAQLVNRRRTR